MRLGLDRRYWTPLLVILSLLLGFLRIRFVAGGVKTGSELEGAAFFGGMLGGALMPWAAGALAAYGHWIANKARRDRDYMAKVYPARRRAVVHGTVLVLCLFMALELAWHLAQGLPAPPQ